MVPCVASLPESHGGIGGAYPTTLAYLPMQSPQGPQPPSVEFLGLDAPFGARQLDEARALAETRAALQLVTQTGPAQQREGKRRGVCKKTQARQ